MIAAGTLVRCSCCGQPTQDSSEVTGPAGLPEPWCWWCLSIWRTMQYVETERLVGEQAILHAVSRRLQAIADTRD